jgi:hypothetical protein
MPLLAKKCFEHKNNGSACVWSKICAAMIIKILVMHGTQVKSDVTWCRTSLCFINCWFSGSDQQEIFIFIWNCLMWLYDQSL